MRYSIALSTLVSLALANTNLPFFWPGGSEGEIGNPDATIISANKSTTVVALNCPSSADETECGWGNGQITFSIVSTSIYQASLGAVNFQCTSSASSKVGCDMQIIEDDQPTSVHTVLTGTDAAMQTATVTAGEDKLKAATAASAAVSTGMATSASAGAAATGTAASATGTAASATGTAAKTSGAGASAASSAAASPSATPGAATRFGVEGAALAALVGAAAFVL